MGYLINLPAHRDRLHFQCEHHTKSCHLEEAKILETEYREASRLWVLCRGHYSLLCHNHKNFERLTRDLRAFSRIQQDTLCEIQASQDFLDDLIRRLADVDANRVTRF